MSEEKEHAKKAEEPRKDLDVQLQELEQEFLQIQKSHRQQSFVRIAGTIGILAAVLLFAKNIWDTAKGFDGEKFSKSLVERSNIITENPSFNGIKDDLREVMIPMLKNEIIEAFKRNMPRFREEGANSIELLNTYLNEELKNEVCDRLTERLNLTEKKILAQYDPNDAAAISEAFEKMNEKFIEELTAMLETELRVAINSLGSLDAEIQDFRNTPEYADAVELGMDEIQNKLLEAFLEIWLYELDPAKGAAPAVQVEAAAVVVEVK